jgi:hypothetical protein
MSRSRKGSKGPGYDYWTKRPGNNGAQGFGPDVKRHTHRLERIENKKAAPKEQKENEDG